MADCIWAHSFLPCLQWATQMTSCPCHIENYKFADYVIISKIVWFHSRFSCLSLSSPSQDYISSYPTSLVSCILGFHSAHFDFDSLTKQSSLYSHGILSFMSRVMLIMRTGRFLTSWSSLPAKCDNLLLLPFPSMKLHWLFMNSVLLPIYQLSCWSLCSQLLWLANRTTSRFRWVS